MELTKENEPIWLRADGIYEIQCHAGRYAAASRKDNPNLLYDIDEVEAYLAEHPEALVPEPVPEPPSKEEIERQRVAGIQAQLDALDRKSIRALRALVAGNPTAEDNVVLAELDAKAEQLRAGL